MKRLLLALFITGVVVRAAALPLEWLLLTGDSRERLVTAADATGANGYPADWRDLDVKLRTPGRWIVSPSSNRFYRAALRW